MKTIVTNIRFLVQTRNGDVKKISGKGMKELPVIENAWMSIDGNIIEDYGTLPYEPAKFQGYEVVDAKNGCVFPSWVDSHTHMVYAGNRESEFVDRINGLSYSEIASRGGGILNSAKKLAVISDQELYEQSYQRLDSVMKIGTGVAEIKSGYGLSLDAELKMLRVIKRLKENHPIAIKSTFLGAHALPLEYKEKKTEYMTHVIDDILPKVAEENLAEFIDIFCEQGYFDVEDTRRLLEAGKKYGLIGKTHVNQFNSIGGIQESIAHGALSVDHLEELTDEDLESLISAPDTIPVGLPGCSLFLSIPYTPARKLIDAGLAFALATDFNPGSCPSGNMNLVVSLACIKMNMTPEEAINASTINGAYALGLEDKFGSITKGKIASFFITKEIPSYSYLPYSFGENVISQIFIEGKKV